MANKRKYKNRKSSVVNEETIIEKFKEVPLSEKNTDVLKSTLNEKDSNTEASLAFLEKIINTEKAKNKKLLKELDQLKEVYEKSLLYNQNVIKNLQEKKVKIEETNRELGVRIDQLKTDILSLKEKEATLLLRIDSYNALPWYEKLFKRTI